VRALLYTYRGEPRLFLPGVVAVVVAFVCALAALTLTERPRTDEDRAQALLSSGKPARAERMYLRILRERPSVPAALALIQAHALAKAYERVVAKEGENMGLPKPEPALDDVSIDLVLSEIPHDVALAARFLRATLAGDVAPEIRSEVSDGAEREPPMPWANHLLAREAEAHDRMAEAAAFYEKEGVRFRERRGDVDAALRIWIQLDAWDTVRERLADPKVAEAAGPGPKYKLAVHDRNWRAAVRNLPALWTPSLRGTGIGMAAASALGWAFFCARLGKMGQRWRFRLPMYASAFVLGVLSVLPTVFLIAVEEAQLRLVETGDAARDVLFFVFGVGLREELSKILLFLPLLPILRRKGDKLDVLVCGALVGLGFAAEENLGYLAQENLSTGLGRFLTANFFHMALTGTLASAVDDFVSDRERHAEAFFRTSLFVVVIHGGYDFMLSHAEFGGAYFAMMAFVFLTRLFLDAVDVARRRADRGITPLHAFVIAVAVVTGVSLAYAVLTVGAKGAFLVLGSGLLGQAIIVAVFVRSLRRI
jgi:protease PrsW